MVVMMVMVTMIKVSKVAQTRRLSGEMPKERVSSERDDRNITQRANLETMLAATLLTLSLNLCWFGTPHYAKTHCHTQKGNFGLSAS